MTDEEALAITQMIAGHWNLKMDEPTRRLWMSTLIDQDAQSSVGVVAHLAKKMHYAPKIVDFREVMRLLHPPQEPPPLMPEIESKRGVEAPEWVWVWSWARFHREEKIDRPFPQQDGHVDTTEMMTADEYETLRNEWLDAGSPKSKHPLPAAMRG